MKRLTRDEVFEYRAWYMRKKFDDDADIKIGALIDHALVTTEGEKKEASAESKGSQ